MAENAWLQRPNADVPWGFRIGGGRDYQEPLRVQRVTVGSIAAQSLTTGNRIIKIGDSDTASLTQGQANELIKLSGNVLQLCISKQSSGVGAQPPSQQFPTKLDRQLSGLHIDNYAPSSPSTYSGEPNFNASDTTPPPGAPGYNYGTSSGAYTPTTPPASYGRQPSYGAQPTSPPTSYGAQPTSPLASYGAQPTSPMASYGSQPKMPQQQQQAAVPDAVLNMAHKGGPDKKPFSYAPDINVIKEQRDRVRRKTPVSTLPRYQQLMNMPSFEELPRARTTPNQTPTETPDSPGFEQGPGEGTFAHLQYNSPMGMYSSGNVEEAFKGQTAGVVTGVGGLPSKGDTDVTQSPTYRLIHGLDKPKSSPKIKLPNERIGLPPADGAPNSSGVDETPFDYSGLKSVGIPSIPSKSFQRLQQMTGGSEIDTTSIRQRSDDEGEQQQIGMYDQASIRYTGRNIPSKSFRMLQNMTGSTALDVPDAGAIRRQRKKQQVMAPPSPQQDADDIVDIRFVGGNIPSRSFRMLQNSVGGPEPQAPAEPTVTQAAPQRKERTGLPPADGAPLSSGVDETPFDYSGLNPVGIPSKSFQHLQQMTSGVDETPFDYSGLNPVGIPSTGSEIDTTSIRQRSDDRVDTDPVGDYDQASIRYTGRNIPSKTFRKLQKLTGCSDFQLPASDELVHTERSRRSTNKAVEMTRRRRRQQSQEDDVDVSNF